MKWKNVKLIWMRELRDQLRDRRTLFMVLVLPLLLYPLIGMAALQISQFMEENAAKVAIVGGEQLPSEVPLLDDNGIRSEWFSTPDRVRLLEVRRVPDESTGDPVAWAKERLVRDNLDAVLYFPPGFGEQLRAFFQDGAGDLGKLPAPRIVFESSKDRSRIAFERLAVVLSRWRAQVVQRNFTSRNIPPELASPFAIQDQDVAEGKQRQAALWSKILPFVLVIWALTGAFYPAVDLCAGEKERGTLETLLCSPADRQEIVWGKLLTVALFSLVTSLLNLVSMAGTGLTVMSRMQLPMGGAALGLEMPQFAMLVWVVLALLPLSALFSALSLGLATMARSSKEGQYYLMPLLLVVLPLATISIMPSSEIGLGNALIPVTGVMMVLRALLEGEYLEALRFVVPVAVVTGACCMLAIRWAVHQFNDESVLFRESEQFSPLLWVRSMVRDRGLTPSLSQAFMAGVLLLVLQFFARLFGPSTMTWGTLMQSTVLLQLGLVAAPVVLLSLIFTASPTRTLLLRPAAGSSLACAVLLAFVIQPAAASLRDLIQWTYPISPQMMAPLAEVAKAIQAAPTWQVVLVLAILPAICEELAFRGFILSGLRHLGSKGMAILIASLFFGVVHGILQQSLNACVLGMVLGYIAVQTGSLIPCVLFHALHNSIQLLSGYWMNPETLASHPALGVVFVAAADDPQRIVYRMPMLIASILASGLLMGWFRSLPFSPTPEERLQEALDHQATAVARH
jgi:sodium transport system permease protein